MITLNSLNSLKVKDLAQEAKKHGVPGWHSLRKDELIAELLKLAKKKQRGSKKVTPKTSKAGEKASVSSKIGVSNSRRGKSKQDLSSAIGIGNPKIVDQLRKDREREENLKNLSLISSLDREQRPPTSDRLILVMRDAFWVQAYWEITKNAVQRANIALAGGWYSAQPVLRLLEVSKEGNTNATEQVVQEFVIHGGVKNWFIHLKKPGGSYRAAIGYRSGSDKFHLIAKSNQVNCPNGKQPFDENWTDITNDAEKFFALSGGFDQSIPSDDLQAVFEEKTRHPIHAPAFERLGSGINGHSSEFEFQVDAHLIISGATNPNGSISIAGEPVKLQRDGSFSVKVDLPDRRQVLPVVACSRDGTQQRTTVLAVERNTKTMEPLINDLEVD